MEKLTFSKRNQKLNHLAAYLGLPFSAVRAFDLPAGYTCPKAHICKAFANRQTGKLTRGKDASVLCYAAKGENYLPTVRESRWRNFQALIDCAGNVEKMAALLGSSIPNGTKVVRIHSSGDFFSWEYFQAWNLVAVENPKITFYGYSKILDYVTLDKPDNFSLVFSYGSKDDTRRDFLESDGWEIPTCYIDATPGQWEHLGIPVICGKGDEAGDYGYILSGLSFRLGLH